MKAIIIFFCCSEENAEILNLNVLNFEGITGNNCNTYMISYLFNVIWIFPHFDFTSLIK